ncbi:MAG TPA: methyltransferase domain-containing protein [Ilumatobacteraceae bacterium]|nr:methyltransferase domain-containing protein [Ilumatobacteraceae bacterium]
MQEDGQRWNERYAAAPVVEARSPEALEHWPDLASVLPTTGRCVDVASGPGAVTLWLADRGLDVTALDASSVAVDLLTSAAAAAGTTGRIDARVIDLDDGLPDDLSGVDLVVCQRFRDPMLYQPIIEALRLGGIAIVTVLSSVGADEPGAFHAPAGELVTAFGADERCAVMHQLETDGVAHIVFTRR